MSAATSSRSMSAEVGSRLSPALARVSFRSSAAYSSGGGRAEREAATVALGEHPPEVRELFFGERDQPESDAGIVRGANGQGERIGGGLHLAVRVIEENGIEIF